MSRIATALADPDLRAAIMDALADVAAGETPLESAVDAFLADVLLPALEAPRPARAITPAHLRLVYLLALSGGATDTQLLRHYEVKVARSSAAQWPFISGSGLRSRRAELVAWGLVEWSGAWGRTIANRPSRIWQLVTTPHALLEGAAPVPAFDRETRLAHLALLEEAGSELVIRSALQHVASAAGDWTHIGTTVAGVER